MRLKWKLFLPERVGVEVPRYVAGGNDLATLGSLEGYVGERKTIHKSL